MVKSCRIRGTKHDDGRTGPTVMTPSSAETERTDGDRAAAAG